MAYWGGRRVVAAMTGLALAITPGAASANFFWKSPDLRGAPVRGDEPGLFLALPGATPAELQAALVWNLRAGLNVAALQCQFDPTLLTLNQYNHLLGYHGSELAASFGTLSAYFKRTNKVAKVGQSALDQYGTRTYSGFSTVGAQLTFCEAASKVGRKALFAPRGQLYAVAQNYLREMKTSLSRHGEQQFIFYVPPYYARMPSFEDNCWRGGSLQARCAF